MTVSRTTVLEIDASNVGAVYVVGSGAQEGVWHLYDDCYQQQPSLCCPVAWRNEHAT